MSACQINKERILFERLKNGDKSAFTEIYNKYWVILFLYAQKLLGSSDDAEDLTQEVLSYLWNKKEDIVIETNLSAYLYGAVRFKSYNLIEHRKIRMHYLDSLYEFANRSEYITDNYLREKELNKTIEEITATLPPRVRQIFELSRKEHLTQKEIAKKLNISDKTVKKQISIALKIFRKRIKHAFFFMF